MRVRGRVLGLLVLVVGGLIWSSPADAWYGHRNYRSYRYGRVNNRVASAASALGAAQSRLYAAKVNAAQQVRQARYKAQNSSGLASAKSADQTARNDVQSARDAAIKKLKATNPEFKDLLDQANAKRARIASLVKSGNSPDEVHRLNEELRNMTRKANLIEDQALAADSSLKDVSSHKADTHAALQSAEQKAQAAVAQDPNVLAAQRQLSQAATQAQQAASKYNSALNSGYGGYGYPHRRRYGYVGYGGGGYGFRHYSHHPHHIHYASHRRR